MKNPFICTLIFVFSTLISIAQTERGAEKFYDSSLFNNRRVTAIDFIKVEKEDLKVVNPNDIESYFDRGIALLEKGKAEEALQDFNKIDSLYHDIGYTKYLKGICFKALGSEDSAKYYFKETLKIEPTFSQAYLELGYFELSRRKYKKAKALFEKARQFATETNEVNYAYSLMYIMRGRRSKAIKELEKCLAYDANDAKIYFQMGYIEYSYHRFKKAIDYFSTAIQKDAAFKDAYLFRGLMYLYRDKINLVYTDWNKLIELDPENGGYRKMIGLLMLVENKHEEAIENLAKGYQLSPVKIEQERGSGTFLSTSRDFSFAITYYYENSYKFNKVVRESLQLGLCEAIKEDYTKALAYFNKVVRIDPKNDVVYYLKGLCYEYLRETEEAYKNYTKALGQHPRIYDIRKKRGLMAYKINDYKNAMIDYTYMIHLQPKFILGYKYRGIVRLKSGDLAGAALDFEDYLKKDSTDRYVWYHIGLLEENRKQYDKALEVYNFLLKKEGVFYRKKLNEPRFKPIKSKWYGTDRDADLLHGRARCYLAQKKYDNAIADCDTLLMLYQNKAKFYNYRGHLKRLKEDYSAAHFDFTKALEIDAGYHPALFNLGLLYMQQEQNEQAEGYFSKAIYSLRKDAGSYYFRGLVRAKMGNQTKACEDFRKAVELGIVLEDNEWTQKCP